MSDIKLISNFTNSLKKDLEAIENAVSSLLSNGFVEGTNLFGDGIYSDLHETSLTSVWTTPAGETVQWVAYEHCVVLTGYDMDSQTIYVSDPLVGNTSYDLSKIRKRYIDMGQQSVWVG